MIYILKICLEKLTDTAAALIFLNPVLHQSICVSAEETFTRFHKELMETARSSKWQWSQRVSHLPEIWGRGPKTQPGTYTATGPLIKKAPSEPVLVLVPGADKLEVNWKWTLDQLIKEGVNQACFH